MADRQLVIAHRGASGYLPEHTSEAKALAHAMEADYLEQDVVLTKDDVPVVLHDIHLDTVTDVAKVFPDRAREDGRYYALDLTLDEIRRLHVTERIDLKTGKAVFPKRFPIWSGDFQVATLEDELELIAGLNSSTGRAVGIYTEIKQPAWHRKQGRDPSRLVIEALAKVGYRDRKASAFIQCFEFDELKRIRRELGCELPLVQLLGGKTSTSDEALCSAKGLAQIAGFAQGIGPAIDRILDLPTGGQTRAKAAPLTQMAHDAGLVVHPYTIRVDALPRGITTVDDLHHALFVDAQVDGVFTDFPDRTGQWLRSH